VARTIDYRFGQRGEPVLPLATNGSASRRRAREKCLLAIAARFNDSAVLIDTAVSNRARNVKLPGTMTRKGDSTPERPNRRSRRLSGPERAAPVSIELIEQLAAEAPETARRTGDTGNNNASGFDVGAFLARHAIEIRTGPVPYEGGRKWILEQCPFNAEHKNDPAVFEYAGGVLGFKCFHKSCEAFRWKDFRELFEGRRDGPNNTKQPAKVEDWHEFTPLESFPLESLPEDVLPGSLGRMVEAVARAAETPRELAAMMGVGVVALSIAGKIEIAPIRSNPQYRETTNLFTCAVMESGNRKSGVELRYGSGGGVGNAASRQIPSPQRVAIRTQDHRAADREYPQAAPRQRRAS
jgi:hypothetical protein